MTINDLRKACEAIWVAGLGTPWATLAFIPSGPDVEVVPWARELAAVGSEYYGRAVEFLDATNISFKDSRALVERLVRTDETGSLVLALANPISNEAALLLARSADRVVLALAIGQARLSDAREVVEVVGRERFLGAATVVSD